MHYQPIYIPDRTPLDRRVDKCSVRRSLSMAGYHLTSFSPARECSPKHIRYPL